MKGKQKARSQEWPTNGGKIPKGYFMICVKVATEMTPNLLVLFCFVFLPVISQALSVSTCKTN